MSTGDNHDDERRLGTYHTTCPECDGRVETNSHESVCVECGLVLTQDRVDHGPEWRSFPDDGDDRERTGAPRTVALHDGGLSTQIGYDGDVAPARRNRLARQRRLHSRSRFESKRERNRAHGLSEIRRMCAQLELETSHRDQACVCFRQAQDADLLMGRSLEAMASASVYAVCRVQSVPVTIRDVGDVSRVAQSRVANAYTVLNTELGLPTPPRRPREFLPQFASAIDASAVVRRRAQELLNRAEESGVAMGRHPAGVAAACLEIACAGSAWQATQTELAELADVSTATVRKSRDAIVAGIEIEYEKPDIPTEMD